MNKEQKELLVKAYENYCKEYWNLSFLQDKIEYGSSFYNHDTVDYTFEELTQEEFIDKCKTDTELSERWGLKIEERELRLEERCELGYKYVDSFEWDMLMGGGREGDEGNCNDYKIPTKAITITYNDKTIESYE